MRLFVNRERYSVSINNTNLHAMQGSKVLARFDARNGFFCWVALSVSRIQEFENLYHPLWLLQILQSCFLVLLSLAGHGFNTMHLTWWCLVGG